MARIDLPPAESPVLFVSPSVVTAPREGRRNIFATILKTAARAAAGAIPVVGPAISAAVDAATSRHTSRIGPFEGQSETLEFLQLQRDIERETRAFETASNVMKARHDAAMNSIRNLKS